MRIGKWPCFVATFTLCVLLLQRCSRVEPSPADDVEPLERLVARYAELHARTLAAAARQHAEMCRVRGATALTDPSGLLGPDAPGFNHARTQRPHAGGRSRSAWSKCSPWQLLSSATVPRQEAPGGSWQLGTPRARPSHWALSRRVTLQAASVRRCATALTDPSGPDAPGSKCQASHLYALEFHLTGRQRLAGPGSSHCADARPRQGRAWHSRT